MDEVRTMDLIKATEAAQILGVDRTTVWRWTEDGRLKAAVKAGQESFYERAYIRGVAQERANRRRKTRNQKGLQGGYRYLFVSLRGIRNESEIYQVDPEDAEDMAQAVEIIASFDKEGSDGYAKWVSKEEATAEVTHNRYIAERVGESGLSIKDIPVGPWGIDDLADYAEGRIRSQIQEGSEAGGEADSIGLEAGQGKAPTLYLLLNPALSPGGRFENPTSPLQRRGVAVYRVDPSDGEQLLQASKLIGNYAMRLKGGGYASFTTEKDALAQVRANQVEAREGKPVGSTEIIDFGEFLAKQKEAKEAKRPKPEPQAPGLSGESEAEDRPQAN